MSGPISEGGATGPDAPLLHETFRILLWGDLALGALYAPVGFWALAVGVPYATDGLEVLVLLGSLAALGGGWMLAGGTRALRSRGSARAAFAGVNVAAGGALVAGLPGGIVVGAIVVEIVERSAGINSTPGELPLLVAVVAPTVWWSLHVLVRLFRRQATRSALAGVGGGARLLAQLRIAWPIALLALGALAVGWLRRPNPESLPALDASPAAWAEVLAREQTWVAARARLRKDPALTIRAALALQDWRPGLDFVGVGWLGPAVFGPVGIRFEVRRNMFWHGLLILDDEGADGRIEIVRLLATSDASIRTRVVEYLAARPHSARTDVEDFPGSEQAVGVLSTALQSVDPAQRRPAAGALRWFGSGAIDPLGHALGDPETGVRWAAIDSLARLARQDPRARARIAAHLTPVLSDPDAGTRAAACKALASCGASAAACLPALGRILAAPSNAEQMPALDLVTAIGPPAAEVMPSIYPMLGDRSSAVRVAAARACWTAGRNADATVPVLVAEAADWRAGRTVIRLLLEIEATGVDALGPLLALLDSPDPKVRLGTARALDRWCPKEPPRVREALRAHLQDPDPKVQRAITHALESLEPSAAPR